jgi:hypothetical protein
VTAPAPRPDARITAAGLPPGRYVTVGQVGPIEIEALMQSRSASESETPSRPVGARGVLSRVACRAHRAGHRVPPGFRGADGALSGIARLVAVLNSRSSPAWLRLGSAKRVEREAAREMRDLRIYVLALALAGLVASGCGDDDDGDEPAADQTTEVAVVPGA